MSLEPYYLKVENTIQSLGVDPVLCRNESAGQWTLTKGSATVWIDVFPAANNSGYLGYLRIMAKLSDIPSTNREAFFQELLEISYDLYGVAITKFEQTIYVKMIRELEGIDESEILASFNRVGYYTDKYDDELKNKYFPATPHQPGEPG